MSRHNLPLLEVPIGDYGADEPAIVAYREAGTRKALALDNRGPLRFDADGEVAADILDAYNRYGFYVFEGVFDQAELDEIEADVAEMLDRAPVTKDAAVDRRGRPALGVGLQARNVGWVRPLSDPLGGTSAAHGRHQAKMIEPEVPDGAPEHVVQIVLGSLQFSAACLRVYGHPGLLKFTEDLLAHPTRGLQPEHLAVEESGGFDGDGEHRWAGRHRDHGRGHYPATRDGHQDGSRIDPPQRSERAGGRGRSKLLESLRRDHLEHRESHSR